LPMGLIASGQVDIFMEDVPNKAEIYSTYKEGVILALRAVLDPPKSYQARHFWRMTSGTRLPFMLASISDNASFNRLRKHFNLRLHKPVTQQEHWQLFVEVANHEAFPGGWCTELIVFSKKWLKPAAGDAWKLFRLALLERAWKASEYIRNTNIFNKMWSKFISEIRNKKVNSLITVISKYIIEASLGQASLHTISNEKNIAGPFNELTSLFMDIYQLRRYAPIIMVTDTFGQNGKDYGFISAQMPNLRLEAKSTYKNNKTIADMREIKYVITQFINKINTGYINVNDTPFTGLANINFDFYYADEDKYNELLPAVSIFEGIEAAEKWKRTSENNLMPYRNGFTRGCVRVSAK